MKPIKMSRAERIAKGICLECPRKTINGTQRCLPCGVRNSERAQRSIRHSRFWRHRPLNATVMLHRVDHVIFENDRGVFVGRSFSYPSDGESS
jgi:hypothetical protein